jgi:hypothetical protein
LFLFLSLVSILSYLLDFNQDLSLDETRAMYTREELQGMVNDVIHHRKNPRTYLLSTYFEIPMTAALAFVIDHLDLHAPDQPISQRYLHFVLFLLGFQTVVM